MSEFPQQEKWFRAMPPLDLAIRAMRDLREALRCSDHAEHSPTIDQLVRDMALYAEERLVEECGATPYKEQLRQRVLRFREGK